MLIAYLSFRLRDFKFPRHEKRTPGKTSRRHGSRARCSRCHTPGNGKCHRPNRVHFLSREHCNWHSARTPSRSSGYIMCFQIWKDKSLSEQEQISDFLVTISSIASISTYTSIDNVLYSFFVGSSKRETALTWSPSMSIFIIVFFVFLNLDGVNDYLQHLQVMYSFFWQY